MKINLKLLLGISLTSYTWFSKDLHKRFYYKINLNEIVRTCFIFFRNEDWNNYTTWLSKSMNWLNHKNNMNSMLLLCTLHQWIKNYFWGLPLFLFMLCKRWAYTISFHKSGTPGRHQWLQSWCVSIYFFDSSVIFMCLYKEGWASCRKSVILVMFK